MNFEINIMQNIDGWIVFFLIISLYDIFWVLTLQMRCFYDNTEHTLMVFQDECICNREAEKDEN